VRSRVQDYAAAFEGTNPLIFGQAVNTKEHMRVRKNLFQLFRLFVSGRNGESALWVNISQPAFSTVRDSIHHYGTMAAKKLKDTSSFKLQMEQPEPAMMFLFENVLDDSFSIIEPGKFCKSLLHEMEKEINRSSPEANFGASFLQEFSGNLRTQALGCQKTCPMCNAKCVIDGDHQVHSTTRHVFQAFRGWRSRSNDLAALQLCNDSTGFSTQRYLHKSNDDDKMALLLTDYLKTYHKHWNITEDRSRKVTAIQMRAWRNVGRRISAHYKMEYHEPPTWSSEMESACPVCLDMLPAYQPPYPYFRTNRGSGNVGVLTLSCSHRIHSKCLDDLRKYRDSKCPICRQEVL